MTCPICIDDDSSAGELIVPCLCAFYTHRSCLDKWRTTAIVPEAMTRCPTCKAYYEFEEVEEEEVKKQCKRQMRIEVVKRFVYVILTVILGSFFMFLFDKQENGLLVGVFPSSWPKIIVYILSGTLITLFIIGAFHIIKHIYFCCYYHFGRYKDNGYTRAQREHYSCSLPQNDTCICVDCPVGGCEGGDCKEILMVCLAIFTIIAILVGICALFYFIIGGVATGIDNHFQTSCNKIDSKYRKVKNLKPHLDNI